MASDRHSQVRWQLVRAHDQPRLMGVAIAIYFPPQKSNIETPKIAIF